VVVLQQSAQPLAATNVGTLARAGLGRNQLVAESLVVPLSGTGYSRFPRPNGRAGADFIAWVTSAAVQRTYAEAGGIPSRKSLRVSLTIRR
jgi:hypothetical protein